MHPEDSESSYYYNWHRFYNPETGRYLTSDPISLAGGLNTYGYVGQNPYNGVDPWGLFSISKDGTTTFFTNFQFLPSFSIPTQRGWEDYHSRDNLYHEYDQSVFVDNLDGSMQNKLLNFMIQHPTPNSKAKAATTSGTYNPATPDFGQFAGTLPNLVSPDDVTSFVRKGIDGKNYIVNVTQANHFFAIVKDKFINNI